MKLIDRTPLQDEKGEIGIIQRIQGTLQFGMNWYPELEAQKFALMRLERGLAKGYVVIRNYTLGASGIVVPLAIFGPAGVFAVHVTHLKGQYRAKGDSWGSLSGNSMKPASINLLTRTERIARALQAFIERQGVSLPRAVDPILITANPGMHVDSVRPLVRVVMSDAIERWAASLSKSAPVLTVETAYELSDRVINPRIPKKDEEIDTSPAQPEEDDSYYYLPGEKEGQEKIGAYYTESEENQPSDTSGLEFAYEEDESPAVAADFAPTWDTPETPEPVSGKKKRYLGMTIPQLSILGGIFLVWICVMVVFVNIIIQNQ